MLLLAGCASLFGGFGPEPTPLITEVARVAPTFTPTPRLDQVTPEVATATVAPPTVVMISATVAITTAITVQPTASTALTVTAQPRLIVTHALVNIRGGPATTFELLGAATQGQAFSVTGRNAQGDWWQICCVNNQAGWIFGELAQVEQGELVAVIAESPVRPTPGTVAEAPTATPPPVQPTATPPSPAGPPVDTGSSVGDFNPGAQYHIVHFKVLGLGENNGGIRDSSAQHHIFLTVLDQNGNGVDGAVVKNLVGERGEVITGGKGPGKAEITMYWEPFKLYVASDPSGPVTSQLSNQMGLAFPHLPDIVGKLGGLDYEYAVCPTLEIKCTWPIQAVHFSYEITFQKR
jgi:uncharacterized protein YraI